MNLIKNNDGTYTCQECKFVFGQGMINEAEFAEYHTGLHTIVIKNIPDSFKDQAQAEG